ncbi:protein LEAD-SENSITIVE 1 isoform X2 [Alnus glutinosa]|uniref:protein LEAD-SENSITIVE 1 isoform X2 n=1 Tax=Alnus glutinosa TaxID=3517 RepID=UPI002D76FB9B|nr:protein LEAD-SENSITIVE 1 isoform X2 [Alnus glutinosa]
MGLLSNKIERDKLKPGDHIYSWRHAYLYSHHGIYVSDGNVIHFTRGGGQEIGTGTVLDRILVSSSPAHAGDNPCPKCGDQSRLDGVISSCIDCFLSGGELYLFEYGVTPVLFLAKPRGGTCTLAVPDPPEDVIHRATYLLQNGFGVYHIFKNNCEDFAIYCKTGLLVFTSISVGRSGQAASFLAASSAILSSPLRFLTTSFSGLAAVGYGMYCMSRLISDIGVRRDVKKVPVERLVSCSTSASASASASEVHKPEAVTEMPKEEEKPAAGYGMYCISRLISDIGVRRDVKKVPMERLVSSTSASAFASEVHKPEAVTEMPKEEEKPFDMDRNSVGCKDVVPI